ncbi:MAG TPA: rhodanese-like domain-containing protein [Pyrinomonadaceae bacterium]
MKRLYRLEIPFLIVVCLITSHGYQSTQALAQGEKPNAGIAFISAEELKAKVSSNEPLVIIDVRSSNGYASSDRKIKGAIHVKVRNLQHRLSFAPLKDIPRDRQVITYCACPADESSVAAARVLLENGFKNVRALKGGWQEWLKVSGQTETKQRG